MYRRHALRTDNVEDPLDRPCRDERGSTTGHHCRLNRAKDTHAARGGRRTRGSSQAANSSVGGIRGTDAALRTDVVEDLFEVVDLAATKGGAQQATIAA